MEAIESLQKQLCLCYCSLSDLYMTDLWYDLISLFFNLISNSYSVMNLMRKCNVKIFVKKL